MVLSKTLYPIGIDMAEHDLSIAQVRRQRKGLMLRGVAHHSLEPFNGDDPSENKELIAAIKDLSKKNGFSGRSAALHLPHDKIFSYPITFRISEGESVESAIVKESQEFLPFPLEEAVLDYPSIDSFEDDDGKHYRAIITAIKLSDLNQYIRLLKRVGLILERVDLPSSSLLRLYQYFNELNERPVILCHVGNKETLLCVATKESILFQRNIRWGLSRLLKKIENELELGPGREAGKAILEKYGLCYEDALSGRSADGDGPSSDMHRAIYQVLMPQVDALIEELHKIMGYLRTGGYPVTIEGIFLFGPGIVIQNLEGVIERQINIPSKKINPLVEMGLDQGKVADGPSSTLALGLAMGRVTWL